MEAGCGDTYKPTVALAHGRDHLAHVASVMHLRGTAGGKCEALVATAPAVHHYN